MEWSTASCWPDSSEWIEDDLLEASVFIYFVWFLLLSFFVILDNWLPFFKAPIYDGFETLLLPLMIPYRRLCDLKPCWESIILVYSTSWPFDLDLWDATAASLWKIMLGCCIISLPSLKLPWLLVVSLKLTLCSCALLFRLFFKLFDFWPPEYITEHEGFGLVYTPMIWDYN